jgi:hypothetical protein
VYNETKLLDKIRPLNERKVTKTRNPSRKRAPQLASRRKVGCCEQQINNNAHPIYLARDEVAETPGKEEGKSPKGISTWERRCIVIASWDKGVYV